MTPDESTEDPKWAANLVLWSTLTCIAKSGTGDNCCDPDRCCTFLGDIMCFNASHATGLAEPLTFSEAAELERKAGMFEDIAKAIRLVLAKFPPQ